MWYGLDTIILYGFFPRKKHRRNQPKNALELFFSAIFGTPIKGSWIPIPGTNFRVQRMVHWIEDVEHTTGRDPPT